MENPESLVGKVYGTLTVINQVPGEDGAGDRLWLCFCSRCCRVSQMNTASLTVGREPLCCVARDNADRAAKLGLQEK
jgi:hypothetical protein